LRARAGATGIAAHAAAAYRARRAGEGRSPLEIRFAEFLRTHRIPAPAQNVLVLGHEVDALWPGAKLVVELDSWEHHGDRGAFEWDRARDPKLLLAGYRTIRITHRRLDSETREIAEQIRALLAQRTLPVAASVD
jgi:very-short-patch-repair endonuclease